MMISKWNFEGQGGQSTHVCGHSRGWGITPHAKRTEFITRRDKKRLFEATQSVQMYHISTNDMIVIFTPKNLFLSNDFVLGSVSLTKDTTIYIRYSCHLEVYILLVNRDNK